jgi:hypothetical protein
MKRLTYLTLLLFVLLLAACGGRESAEPTAEIAMPLEEAAFSTALETAVPAPTVTSAPQQATPTEAPTAGPFEEAAAEKPAPEEPDAETADEPEPTATVELAVEIEEPAPLEVVSGQTAEGAYFYGSLDAPVTLFDYSDFL